MGAKKSQVIEPIAPVVAGGLVPGLLTIMQTCGYLNRSRTTVHFLLKSGAIRSVKVGSHRLIPLAELNRYIERLVADEWGDVA